MFFSAVMLGILRRGGGGIYGIDYILEPASSGQSMNYSYRVSFTRESGRLPLVTVIKQLPWFPSGNTNTVS